MPLAAPVAGGVLGGAARLLGPQFLLDPRGLQCSPCSQGDTVWTLLVGAEHSRPKMSTRVPAPRGAEVHGRATGSRCNSLGLQRHRHGLHRDRMSRPPWQASQRGLLEEAAARLSGGGARRRRLEPKRQPRKEGLGRAWPSRDTDSALRSKGQDGLTPQRVCAVALFTGLSNALGSGAVLVD